MKLKAMVAAAAALIMTVSSFACVSCAEEAKDEYYFNFTKQAVSEAVNLSSDMGKAKKYDNVVGYGFVNESSSMPSRSVNSDKIRIAEDGYVITENNLNSFVCRDEDGEIIDWTKSTTHNFGGMIFRVKLPSGGYHIEVETGEGESNSIVSVNAMQSARMATAYWDAAKLVENRHKAEWSGNVWKFDYANGCDFIDVEIEPKECGKPVTLKSIKIIPVENNSAVKPTVYLLGDSTLKSYLFEEAPMCGWGQVFDRLFDKDKINVVNYSMGGRSLKSMYQEGRLNDVLMTGSRGDYVLVQSGHNDEKTGADSDPTARFGVGSTEAMYKSYIEKYYIPAIRARGMIPVLVTPMTRVKAGQEEYKDSFTTEDRQFPRVMREAAEEMNVPLVDLNAGSVEYLNSIGTLEAEAIVMSLEAGETPGKTNSGSYANGHPQNKIDGTHMKEALAKQYARIVAEDIKELASDFDYLKAMTEGMTDDVKAGNWDKVYPEVCADVKGENAYYRNQIEKMVQLGIMSKDSNGNFNPKGSITAAEYANAVERLWAVSLSDAYKSDESLTRELMACINLEAYNAKFDEKPRYMTDYNGSNITPDNPEYDPNLIGEEAQYYPLVGFEALEDKQNVSREIYGAVKNAYELGLIRSNDVERGKMMNSLTLEPKLEVTRDKAAKSLYFMYVLGSDINSENDITGE